MLALLSLLGVLGLFVLWAIYDFVVSIGKVPGQHTASMYIKLWVRSRPWHKLLAAVLILDGALYLFLHLVLQVI